MNITFKKPQEADRELFLSLMYDFYHSDAVLHPTDRALHVNTFNEIIRGEEYLVCYLIEADGENAGYALLSKSFSPEVGGPITWIEEILVKESFRGKGIGKSFFSFIEEKHPSARFRLEVEPDNKRALSLYESLGYKQLPYLQMVKDK